MKKLFFSFDGRISRGEFWRGLLLLVVLAIAGAALYVGAIGLDALLGAPKGSRSNAIAVLIIYLLLFSPYLALLTKRLHDRGKSGWWSIVVVIPQYFYAFGDAMGLAAIIGFSNLFHYLSGTLYAAATIWMLIELGLLKGVKGANTYGDDPLNPGTLPPGTTE